MQHVLARVFGDSDMLFDRRSEQAIFAALAEAGVGPKLLVRLLLGNFGSLLHWSLVLSNILAMCNGQVSCGAFCYVGVTEGLPLA
jgi:hypothetical protein